MRRPSRSGVDDHWVDVARRFLARQDQHAPRPDQFDIAIGNALALSRAADPHRRWRLEALLLTGEPLESVALRCALPSDVVESYHALFFACRDRLDARDWLTVVAVGCGPWNEFAGSQPEGLWKYAAFSGGPVLLDVMIAVTTGKPMPESVRAAFARNPGFDEDRLRMGVRLTTALMTSRSPDEMKSLIAIHDDLLGLSSRKVRGREKSAPLTRLVRSFTASRGGQGPSREAPHTATETKGPSRTQTTVSGRRLRSSAESDSVT